NNLNSTATLKYITEDNNLQTKLIKPDSTVSITGFGGWCSCQGNCLADPIQDSIINEYFMKTIYVYKNASILSKKDLNKIENWSFESTDGLGIYKIDINEEDF
ncbi:MAG: hypothetical protein GYA71_03060, partial [Bacteroidales bacterium]|nr:hypothetical protein [Bacteroidales bacterium]